jgi:hypothetical protein
MDISPTIQLSPSWTDNGSRLLAALEKVRNWNTGLPDNVSILLANSIEVDWLVRQVFLRNKSRERVLPVVVTDSNVLVGPMSFMAESACIECMTLETGRSIEESFTTLLGESDNPTLLHLQAVIGHELSALASGSVPSTLGAVIVVPVDGGLPSRSRVWQVDGCNSCAALVELAYASDVDA